MDEEKESLLIGSAEGHNHYEEINNIQNSKCHFEQKQEI